jgi:hypothetical protein
VLAAAGLGYSLWQHYTTVSDPKTAPRDQRRRQQQASSSNAAASASSSSTSLTRPFPGETPSSARRLEKLHRVIQLLRKHGGQVHSDVERSPSPETGGASSIARPDSRDRSVAGNRSVEIILRDIRKFAKWDRQQRIAQFETSEGSEDQAVFGEANTSATPVPTFDQVDLRHRLACVKVLLLYHDCAEPQYASFDSETEAKQKAKSRLRADDLRRCWVLLDGKWTEARELDAQGYRPPLPTPAAAFPGSPPPTFEQEVLINLLIVSNRLEDAKKMDAVLKLLLQIDASDTFATTVIQPRVLRSLTREALLHGFTVAPLLGRFIWTFQLGQQLLDMDNTIAAADRDAASAASRSASSSSSVSGARSSPLPSALDTISDFHESAVENPQTIDYSILFDIALQRIAELRELAIWPTILQQMGSQQQQAVQQNSLLPFDWRGRQQTADNRATASPLPSAFPSLPPTPSLRWSRWRVVAYQTSLVSVSIRTSDSELQQLLERHLRERQDMFQCKPPRSLAREGDVFRGIGLFGQRLPLCGMIVHDAAQRVLPLSASLELPDTQGACVSMQGYVYVKEPQPAAAASAFGSSTEESVAGYTQFESYTLWMDHRPPAEVERNWSPPGLSSASANTPVSPAPSAKEPMSSSTSSAGSISSSLVSAAAAPRDTPLMLPGSMMYSAGADVTSRPPSHPTSAFQSPLVSPAAIALGSRQDSKGSEDAASSPTHQRLFESASFVSVAQSNYFSPLRQASDAGTQEGEGKGGERATGTTPPIGSPSPAVPGSPFAALLAFADKEPNAEVWSGTYCVIQEPDKSATGEQTRPRVECHYKIRIVVQKE